MQFLSTSTSKNFFQDRNFPSFALHYDITFDRRIWLVNLREYSQVLWAQRDILNEAENERSKRFQFSIDCKDYVNSHVALRILLGQYFNECPKRLKINFPHMHRPFLGNNKRGFCISISRSSGIAIIALHAYRQIGVDIERKDNFEDQTSLFLAYSSQSEKDFFLQLNKHQKEYAFWRWWVAKEAYLKAIGTGFMYDPRNISINFLETNSIIKTFPKQLDIEVNIDCFNLDGNQYFFSIVTK